MIEDNSTRPTAASTGSRCLPLLLGLFAASGCAALIYEIVWFQLLQLVIGSSAVSLGVLLGTFMGGMCLGSLLFPRFVSAAQHPLRVYALLELGIGLLGLAVLVAVPWISRLYMANGVHGFAGILLRGVISAVCLLPPTLLMGATLPAMSRWIETNPQGVSWLGFFYGGNIAGAVFGCLLAGFYLLRVHDMAVATYVAAAVNAIAAVTGLALAVRVPHALAGSPSATTPTTAPTGAAINKSAHSVYLVIAISGMCALGAEVVWTRLLSLLLGGTVYTFSIILAVFLAGLGLGSSAGSFLARTLARPRLALGLCQFFLAAAIGWTGWMLAKSLPYWPINPSLSSSPWFTFQIDIARCIWAILPATILWGASFPLALAAVASPGQDPAQLVGRVYAANTVGAIVGSIGASILLIGAIGTQQTQQLLMLCSTGAGILMLGPILFSGSAGDREKNSRSLTPARPMAATALLLLIAVSATVVLAWKLPKVPWGLIAHGRYLPTKLDEGKILYTGEGLNASVAVTEMGSGVRNFHVSGKIEASSDPRDMRLQRMLGHIPALLHPRPRSVLIVGCGAGVTAGSFVTYQSIEKIVICEIEPLIPKVVAQYFGRENYNVVRDPRVTIVYDDARHYVLTTKEKFDIITSDPIHPWVKGAATLYTREYFDLCKTRLNPGGLVTQWVPLYESRFDTVKSEVATFFDAFPHGTIWGNSDENMEGYDVVMLGQVEPMRIDLDALQLRLDRDDHFLVAQSLHNVGFRNSMDLIATYAGRGSDLKPWLARAEINRDRNLRLQYLAGMGYNSYHEVAIYNDMLTYRKYPEELFIASDGRRTELKLALESRKTGQ